MREMLEILVLFLVIGLVAVVAVLSFVAGVAVGIKGSVENLKKKGWKVEPPEI